METDQALGRSRGGLTTKLHLACDGRGRPLAMLVTAGQRHESTQLQPLLDAIRVPRPGSGRPRKRPAHLTADRGYSYTTCRQLLRQRRIAHTIPSALTNRLLGPAEAPKVAARPWLIQCAIGNATWSSGRSPGSSSTGPSLSVMTVRIGVCRPGSWSDPRYDWPWCLVLDLSTTGLGRYVLPPDRQVCPDRGLAANKAPSPS